MFRRTAVAVVGLVILGGALVAHPQDKPADKGEHEPRGHSAKIVKVDPAKLIITVKTEDGKTHELHVTGETKFYGPRGGLSEKGIEDDRVAVGNEIRFWMGKSGRKLEEIHLPVRKGDEKKPADKKPNEK
ncbi:MAG: hypothetical protein ACJ8F7_04040 [Gemmataceae bacterium]